MTQNVQANVFLRKVRPEVASRRIQVFSQKFGPAHLLFAQHAAFPLTLTPDLAYRLWANFQRDISGEKLAIPWIAVANLLLSSLCDEVGYELFEMNSAVREALLNDLIGCPQFGEQRLRELSSFLLKHIEKQLGSHDPDIRALAGVQRWTALAYVRPGEVAQELAQALRQSMEQQDRPEQIHLVSLLETFAEPLRDFTPLITYARGVGHLLKGNTDQATAQFRQATSTTTIATIQVQGISLPIPQQLSSQPIQSIYPPVQREDPSPAYEQPDKVAEAKQSYAFAEVAELEETIQGEDPEFKPISSFSEAPEPAKAPTPNPTLERPNTIEIFCAYAQEDEPFYKQLRRHLAPLLKNGNVLIWGTSDILAGTTWQQQVSQHLETASLILLLISADFLASDNCSDIMEQAVRQEKARIIPILLRSAYWEDTPIAKFQPLPRNTMPISIWKNRDEAFINVVEGIQEVIESIRIASISTPIFFSNVPLTTPAEFYGRRRERSLLLNRTRQGGSTSIVGPRRSGKTWLLTYLTLVAPEQLGPNFQIGYISATHPGITTEKAFVEYALTALGYPDSAPSIPPVDRGLLAGPLEEMRKQGKRVVLCIDEFEHLLSYPDEFGLNFFGGLRALANTANLCMITATQHPLYELLHSRERDYSGSPFTNIFEQTILKPFDEKEAMEFVQTKSEQAHFSSEEREYFLRYSEEEQGQFPPMRLQLVGRTLQDENFMDMPQRERRSYQDIKYWDELKRRIDQAYSDINRASRR